MTEKQLAAIEARNAARTPGEWAAYGRRIQSPRRFPGLPPGGRANEVCLTTGAANSPQYWSDDAAFIAHAPEDITMLLAEVRRLRRLMESIGRDALRELPAVEEALRQERERVVAILKGHLTRCDEKARTIGKATPAWDMAVGACSALDKAIELVNGG